MNRRVSQHLAGVGALIGWTAWEWQPLKAGGRNAIEGFFANFDESGLSVFCTSVLQSGPKG